MLLSVYPACPYTVFARCTALFVVFVMSVLKIPVEKDQQNIHVEKFNEKKKNLLKSYSREIPLEYFYHE